MNPDLDAEGARLLWIQDPDLGPEGAKLLRIQDPDYKQCLRRMEMKMRESQRIITANSLLSNIKKTIFSVD